MDRPKAFDPWIYHRRPLPTKEEYMRKHNQEKPKRLTWISNSFGSASTPINGVWFEVRPKHGTSQVTLMMYIEDFGGCDCGCYDDFIDAEADARRLARALGLIGESEG